MGVARKGYMGPSGVLLLLPDINTGYADVFTF